MSVSWSKPNRLCPLLPVGICFVPPGDFRTFSMSFSIYELTLGAKLSSVQ